ncbi:MAG: beta-lactamase family protein [Sedimentisphaerales bacterium]|nr:beta-lactamase family protein [Sedimentisphaerales bacterium]
MLGSRIVGVQSFVACLAIVAVLSPFACARLTASGPAVMDLAPDLGAVREQYKFPALAAAVIVDGKLCAAGVVGVRKHGVDIKAEPNDPFHLGSCTKAMTASLIGLLVQQGKLTWGTTLAQYFPDLKDKMHPDYRGVTLVHLLSHRAGVPPMTNGFSPVGDEELRRILAMRSPRAQRRRVMEIVLCQPPVNKPGDKQEYSNAGFTIAGVIAETLMGEDYEALLRRLLFEPLGMASAGFGAMGTPGRVDAPWQHRKQGDRLLPIGPGLMSDNPPFITPAGRVHCSITDWAKYIECFLKATRQEQGLLPPDQVRQLKEPPFGGEYALGWEICDRAWGGGKVLTHAGSNGMNYSVAWVAPAKDFAVLAATNRGGNGAPQGLDQVCSAMIKKFLAYK